MANTKKLDAVQVLRAIAAIAVVAHHCIRAATVLAKGAFGPSALDHPWLYGPLAAGVDVFFVISGFIMVLVSGPYSAGQRPISDFLAKRVGRIYPPYFVATALLLLSYFMLYGVTYDFQPRRLLGALTLWPTFGEHHVIEPPLGVAWTLSYEMYFYGMFAISIFLFRGRFLVPLSIALTAICVAAGLLDSPFAVIQFLRNPIIVEFLLGCILGSLYIKKRLPHLSVFAAIVGVVFIFAFFAFEFDDSYALRPLIWGVPAMLVVAYSAGKTWTAKGLIGRIAVFLGDASYSIYLVHVIIIYQLLGKFYRALLPWHCGVDYSIFIDVAVAIIAGALFHVLVERKLQAIHFRKIAELSAA